jgi:hypothetical protein
MNVTVVFFDIALKPALVKINVIFENVKRVTPIVRKSQKPLFLP